MNNIKRILFSFSLIFNFGINAQGVNPGANCGQAGCSTTGTYQNLTNVASMGTYSCLFSTPNPNWLAIGIGATGSVHLQLTQTTAGGTLIDVDFALYGPYTSVAAGCPIGPNTPTVDCSFSGSATEQIDIANAIVGQVYILLVTNYNGQPGTISIQQNPSQPSTGMINCATNFSATTSQTPATCGQPTGSVTVTPNGGFAPYTYSWNIPGNPTTQTVNNVAPGTYTVTVNSSPNPAMPSQTVNPTTATVTVTNQGATYSASSTPSSCPNGANGTATASFNAGAAPGVTATYLWSDPAQQTTQTATGLVPGAYLCNITLSNGCSGTATIVVGANTVAYSGTTTVVSCPGGSDGTATANMSPVVGTLSYLWNDPSAQVTQTATGLTAGLYSCTVTSNIGCTGTVNVTVTEIPGMIGTILNQTDVTCNSGNDGMIEVQVTQGTPTYSYSWDNSVSTTNIANDLYVGTHEVTVTDINGCIITVTGTIGEPNPLSITFLTSPTQICPEDDIQLDVAGVGGSSPYTFTWSTNGTILGTGTSITVDPGIVNTQYCVEISEACGSPVADSCTIISIPVPIVPDVLPNKLADCIPGFFEFSNTSSNSSEIATTYFLFSDGNSYLEQGTDSTSNTFTNPNLYSCYMTITSIYGCVYEDSFINLIDVKPLPIADFTFSSNPATIFETSIQLQDRSSVDVVQWEWLSPGSSPAFSQAENPVFTFPEGEVGIYPVTLIVTSEYGCTDTAIINMNIVQDVIFYAPNTFTPDDDEHNQDWGIFVEGLDIYNFELFIFNRWGQVIWESHDTKAKWDGTYNGQIVQAGTYVWKASGKDSLNDGKYELKGYINVLK
jgi:gliding motility-associated-like protein